MIDYDPSTGFAAYAMFHGLKLHFSSKSYDYIKYNGKTNVNKEAFMRRRDKFAFYKLSRKYSQIQLRDFYISNLIEKDVSWIGEISGPEGESTYADWSKRNQSLTYRYEQDLDFLFDKYDNPNQLLRVPSAMYPELLRFVMQKDVMLETLIIMDDILGFLDVWDKRISDTVVYPTLSMKYRKYKPFLHYDKPKFKSILIEKSKEYA